MEQLQACDERFQQYGKKIQEKINAKLDKESDYKVHLQQGPDTMNNRLYLYNPFCIPGGSIVGSGQEEARLGQGAHQGEQAEEGKEDQEPWRWRGDACLARDRVVL